MHHAEETSPFKKVMPEASLRRETIPCVFPSVALQVPTRGQGIYDILKYQLVLRVPGTKRTMYRSFSMEEKVYNSNNTE
jgi:hypothetical protein